MHGFDPGEQRLFAYDVRLCLVARPERAVLPAVLEFAMPLRPAAREATICCAVHCQSMADTDQVLAVPSTESGSTRSVKVALSPASTTDLSWSICKYG